jgi:mannobiose 2-epimerase
MTVDPLRYKQEMEDELKEILAFWMQFAPDLKNGGFYGRLDETNLADPEAPKGIVLNTRILWSFSAAYNLTKNKNYLHFSKRSYDYILEYFLDREHGGMYWSVDYTGGLLKGRKQIYGQSFCIYAFAEYFKAAGDPAILEHAKKIFFLIERYAYDQQHKGYFEAFGRRWEQETDFRLSPKDANEQKTMNTHLHLLEAYSNLYGVWPDFFLGKQIENLLEVFLQYIIDKKTGHLRLFFDASWDAKSEIISFGHDIEAAWLLQEAAEKTGDQRWIDRLKKAGMQITLAAAEGLDSDGGLWYEYDTHTNLILKEKHWWPQAEAMIGFLNACQLVGDKAYLDQSYTSWLFIKKYIKDYRYGEWYWGVDANHFSMKNQDKLGFWKCPYHNTRACLEIAKRLSLPLFR